MNAGEIGGTGATRPNKQGGPALSDMERDAAETSDYTQVTIVYPKVLEEYIQMAKQHKQYVYAAFEVVIDPDGLLYLKKPHRDKPVWVEIQELIDP